MNADDGPMVRIAGRVSPDVIEWVRANFETESEAVREALTTLMHTKTFQMQEPEPTPVTQLVYSYAMAEHVADLRLQLEEKDRQLKALMLLAQSQETMTARLSEIICDQARAMRLDYRPKRHWWELWK